MKARIPMILLVLSLAALLHGCSWQPQTPAETTSPATEPIDGKLLYAQAVSDATSRKKLTLTIVSEKTTEIGGETFTESASQTLSYSEYGTQSMSASMEETLTIGDLEVAVSEIFDGGTVYSTVNGKGFTGQMTAEAYCERYAPIALLNETLYGSILVEGGANTTTVSFTDPSGAEAWAVPEEASLLSAGGSAVVDAGGSLQSSVYDVSYSYGPATVRQYVKVALEPSYHPVAAIPADAESYVPLEFPDAPRLLETASGYLQQARTVTASASQTLSSQASGLVRTQVVQLNACGAEEAYLANVDTSVDLVDYSRSTETTSYRQTEHFENDQYTITRDGGTPEAESTVTASDMRLYCQNLLVGGVLLPEHLKSATLTDLGDVYLLNLTADEEMAQMLCADACGTLYQDETLLNELASDYATDQMDCYLAIDKYSGLPTAAGIQYSGAHTIEGVQYTLTSQQDQSYYLASLTAREAITGELLTDSQTEPEPLLYRVTGQDGGQLFLFGTVPVGDSRTSHLPAYVCDAFDGADALAVEFEAGNILTQAASDPEAQEALVRNSYYADGTQTDAHLDGALYAKALDVLKAGGGFHANAPLLKPVFWENSIAGFYIRQSYRLTLKDGADVRLIDRAKAAGKEILGLDSGVSQLDLLGSFSDEVQQMLLSVTLRAGRAGYLNALEQRYELWCSGDEDALRAAASAVPAELTPEEIPLYEEYSKAMVSDRSAAFLETAKNYLSSGKTVFYAVDFSHLLTDDGLIKGLQDAGYTVQRVRP